MSKELLVFVIGISGLNIYIHRPDKDKYSNMFLAWTIFLAVLSSSMVFFLVLQYFQLIPGVEMGGLLGIGYWAVLGLLIGAYNMRLMKVLSTHFNLLK